MLARLGMHEAWPSMKLTSLILIVAFMLAISASGEA